VQHWPVWTRGRREVARWRRFHRWCAWPSSLLRWMIRRSVLRLLCCRDSHVPVGPILAALVPRWPDPSNREPARVAAWPARCREPIWSARLTNRAGQSGDGPARASRNRGRPSRQHVPVPDSRESGQTRYQAEPRIGPTGTIESRAAQVNRRKIVDHSTSASCLARAHHRWNRLQRATSRRPLVQMAQCCHRTISSHSVRQQVDGGEYPVSQ